jgi:hypothetical protein
MSRHAPAKPVHAIATPSLSLAALPQRQQLRRYEESCSCACGGKCASQSGSSSRLHISALLMPACLPAMQPCVALYKYTVPCIVCVACTRKVYPTLACLVIFYSPSIGMKKIMGFLQTLVVRLEPSYYTRQPVLVAVQQLYSVQCTGGTIVLQSNKVVCSTPVRVQGNKGSSILGATLCYVGCTRLGSWAHGENQRDGSGTFFPPQIRPLTLASAQLKKKTTPAKNPSPPAKTWRQKGAAAIQPGRTWARAAPEGGSNVHFIPRVRSNDGGGHHRRVAWATHWAHIGYETDGSAQRICRLSRWQGTPPATRDGNGYKPAGFCHLKPVPVKNIYAH